jgi:hypothetical protein
MPSNSPVNVELFASKQFWVSLTGGIAVLLSAAGYSLKDSEQWATALWTVASGLLTLVTMIQGVRGARGPAEKVVSVAGKPVGDAKT